MSHCYAKESNPTCRHGQVYQPLASIVLRDCISPRQKNQRTASARADENKLLMKFQAWATPLSRKTRQFRALRSHQPTFFFFFFFFLALVPPRCGVRLPAFRLPLRPVRGNGGADARGSHVLSQAVHSSLFRTSSESLAVWAERECPPRDGLRVGPGHMPVPLQPRFPHLLWDWGDSEGLPDVLVYDMVQSCDPQRPSEHPHLYRV